MEGQQIYCVSCGNSSSSRCQQKRSIIEEERSSFQEFCELVLPGTAEEFERVHGAETGTVCDVCQQRLALILERHANVVEGEREVDKLCNELGQKISELENDRSLILDNMESISSSMEGSALKGCVTDYNLVFRKGIVKAKDKFNGDEMRAALTAAATALVVLRRAIAISGSGPPPSNDLINNIELISSAEKRGSLKHSQVVPSAADSDDESITIGPMFQLKTEAPEENESESNQDSSMSQCIVDYVMKVEIERPASPIRIMGSPFEESEDRLEYNEYGQEVVRILRGRTINGPRMKGEDLSSWRIRAADRKQANASTTARKRNEEPDAEVVDIASDSDDNGSGTPRGDEGVNDSSPLLEVGERCCLLCLKTELGNESHESNGNKKPSSLVCVYHYLKIQPPETDADLCQSCEVIVNSFSKSFLSLEKFQMEVRYWLKRIYEQISGAPKNRESEQLAQLRFPATLRKEVAKKSCLKTGERTEVDVVLHRIGNATILRTKTQISDTFSGACKRDYSESALTVTATRSTGISAGIIRNKSTGKYTCSICQKQFVARSTARYHYRSTHLGKRYKCDNCGVTYSSNAMLKIHKEKCDGIAPRAKAKHILSKYVFNPKTGKYSCVKCKKEFAQKNGAWFHHDSVHLNKKYKCDICNKTFSRMHSLRYHQKRCKDLLAKQRAKESDPKYTSRCNVCGSKFVSMSQLSRHQRTVHGKERTYICRVCGKTFAGAGNLHEHLAVTHQNRKLNCKFCNKEINYKSSLRRHELGCSSKKDSKEGIADGSDRIQQ